MRQKSFLCFVFWFHYYYLTLWAMEISVSSICFMVGRLLGTEQRRASQERSQRTTRERRTNFPTLHHQIVEGVGAACKRNPPSATSAVGAARRTGRLLESQAFGRHFHGDRDQRHLTARSDGEPSDDAAARERTSP